MFLSNKLSYCITSALLENAIIKKEEVELYKYCYNYFLEHFFYAVIVLCLGVILHCFETTLLFFCMFCFFRQYGGGVHAPTEWLCSIISNSMFAFILIVVPRCSFQNCILWSILFTVSILCILVLAPVENANKHFTETHRKYLRYICITGSIFFTLLFFLFCIMHLCLYYGTMSLCAIVVAISMILGLLFQKGSKNVITNRNM